MQHFFSFSQFSKFISPSTLTSVIAAEKQSVRPWLLFLQTSNFKVAFELTQQELVNENIHKTYLIQQVPTTLPRLSKRLVRNIEYFRSNYLFVFIALFAYCLLVCLFYQYLIFVFRSTNLIIFSESPHLSY